MELALQKWHGAGNDFLVWVTDRSGARSLTPEIARAVCDRHRGVGADGLLLAALDGNEVAMTLFNADGSTAEMSGNGIRCLAAAVARATGRDPRHLAVLTAAGTRTVTLQLDGPDGYGEVDMGEVVVDEPLAGTLGVAGVGNPHVVVRDDVRWSVREREDRAVDLSARVGGANVEFVTVTSRDRVSMTVYERGVGWTLACGTGSVAVAAVLHALGETEATLAVENPGGTLTVTLSGTGATLSGPVRFVADVTLMLP